jgi:ASC-1-like (ASCH) protein
MHKYHLKSLAFQLIKGKKKIIEGRLNKSSFQKINVNDIINFINMNQNIYVKVLDIKNYPTFRNMLEIENFKDVTPLSESIEDSIKIYRNCYSKKAEKKYGVLAIKIKFLIYISN